MSQVPGTPSGGVCCSSPKAILRRQLRERLSAMSEPLRHAKSCAACSLVSGTHEFDNARVIMLLRELPDGEVRASLRARDRTNMARLAQRFGGGGHAPAAGCTLPGPLAEATAHLVAAALEEMELAVAGGLG